jgi:hypothetical protein
MLDDSALYDFENHGYTPDFIDAINSYSVLIDAYSNEFLATQEVYIFKPAIEVKDKLPLLNEGYSLEEFHIK